MRQLEVTAGRYNEPKYAYVDDEDYDRLKKISWHDNGNGYIRGRIIINKKNYHVLLHRYILFGDKCIDKTAWDKDNMIDHINRDKYDNQKKNLQIVNNKINLLNNQRYDRIPKGFITTEDAAARLGYKHASGIYSLVKKGKITKYKICGTACYNEKEIENILKPKPRKSRKPIVWKY